ncbi:MAG: prolipoprotein diacylglyceryl transferase, partial [Hyphomicrobiales bacterium]|nr:prolipoprotein diacylglyceryl transferase [Hyphomicrobiales bacterium]
MIPFPRIDPVALQLGPLAIRWYGLGYVAGLVAGWAILRRLVTQDEAFGAVQRPDPAGIDDMLLFAALGIVIGGRLGDALFYEPGPYLRDPVELFRVWHGGMAFHGGLIGAALGLAWFARRRGLRVLAVWDLAALVAPIGIFIVRIANYIKPELWGRPTDVPWAMIFPGGGPIPRHPSQLYEASLEGLA